jgi:hypothetical protein
MTPTPKLDPRTFDEIVEAGKQRIAGKSDWSDLSPSDPGIVLLDVFAFLTESLLFRLNRLPDRAYEAFLRLIGVTRQPPSAAAATLKFSRTGSLDAPLQIPRGTRVTVARAGDAADAPVFTVASSGTIPSGSSSVEITAYHAEPVDGELAGLGTGKAGQVVTARRAPLVDAADGGLALTVAVEMGPGDRSVEARTIEFGGVAYRIWSRVDDFSARGDDRFVYVADLTTGAIMFAPAVRQRQDDGTLADQPAPLGEAPPAQRAIRLWYWVGGGSAGNVAEHMLTVLKDPLPGVQVTNAQRATGGRALETLENARARGPIEFRRLERAVTARDFEDLASRPAAVARALAMTKAELWAHATPGTVQVLLVPSVPDLEAAEYRISPAVLTSHQTETARATAQRTLDERRPLGTLCEVAWARAKTVTVRVRVVIHRQADRAAVERQVLKRLYQTINPVQTPLQPAGWPFGRPLRSWDVNLIVEAVPGVRYADRVRLVVDSAPDTNVTSVAAAVDQPGTWFAGSGDTVFRSSDDGDGWELMVRFVGQRIRAVRPHPQRPGLVAIVTEEDAGERPSQVHFSGDCLESPPMPAGALPARVNDAAWIVRDGNPLLLLATDAGLFELAAVAGATPKAVVATGTQPELGQYAVAATTDERGAVRVAVAARDGGGVFLSDRGGESGTFRRIGLENKDIRRLVMQYDGSRIFLWAGVTAAGFQAGEGCYRSELSDADLAQEWGLIGTNWGVLGAGTCQAIGFLEGRVLAASERRGVLWLDIGAAGATWSDVRAGLPAQQDGQPSPVRTLAVTPAGRSTRTDAVTPRWIMVGSARGVFRAAQPQGPYASASDRELTDKVTLPRTWLFCSGAHDVSVSYEDASR